MGGGVAPPAPRRLRQVVSTFMMAGLHVPMARMKVSGCASWRCRAHCTWSRWTGRQVSALPWPAAVREALIALGPAFVKVGQILSVRTDLIPPELAEALHSLQSEVPPVPVEAVRGVVEASLGRPIAELFEHFEAAPLAAGSVAQVHRARLPGGAEVVVKVKRPGIDEVVAEDLSILVWLADQMQRHLPAARPYRPAAAAEELRRYTLQELDFRNEARVAREVGQRFASWEEVRVPRIYEATADVIVMDYVAGFPMDDVAALEAHGVDRKALIRLGVEAVLAQIFDFGLFHADPHPGNLHVTPEGELVLLDFGIFGRIGEREKRECALLMWTLSRGDMELASYFLLRMARLEPGADVGAFREAVEGRYRAWQGRSVSEYGFARLVYEEFSLGARHGVVFPPEMVLLGKALVTVEGVVLAVDPSLDLSEVSRPYLDRLRGELFSMEHLREGLIRSMPIWFELSERLPLGLAELTERRLWPAPPAPEPPPRGVAVAPAAILAGALLLSTALPPVIAGWSIPGTLLLLAGLLVALRR